MPTASSRNTRAEASAGRARERPPRLLPAELFLFSAETRDGLRERLKALEAYLGRPKPAPLHDLAFTVSRSYEARLECLAIVASSHADLRAKLARAQERLVDGGRIHDKQGLYYASERLGTGKLAFLFPGENAQYANMFRELCLNFPEVREAFDIADAASDVEADGFLPSALNFPTPGSNGGPPIDEMAQWEKAVSLVHTANTAMARLLEALQLRPDAVLGHSFGELSALEMAGVLRPGEGADRIRFAHHAYLHLRELAQERDLPTGRLLAVGGVDGAQIEQIVARFPDALRVAMENCPHQYVLCASGPRMDQAIAEAEKWLSSEGAICSPLPIGRPYHTGFFEPAFPLEKAYFEEVGVHPPRIEVYSCATTEPFPAEPEAIVEVAARHWMSCVRFQRTIEKLHERGFRVFVDVGPRGNLCAFVGDILSGKPHLAVALNRAQRSDVEQLLNGLGLLAAHGVPLSVEHLHERWGSREVEIGEAAGPRAGKRSLALQLATDLPIMKADGIVLSRSERGASGPPAGAPRPRAEAPVEPAETHLTTRTAPRLASPAASLTSPAVSVEEDETATAMLAYMDTMERFVATQGSLLRALLESGESVPEAAAAPAAAPGRFPLLGSILQLVPGESLVSRRVLDVEEDVFLQDHALGTALSTRDPSLKALPVMPVTFSLEVAAEAGAALFPDRTVVAVEDIRAHRWIFLDQGTVTLQVSARRTEARGREDHVRVAIREETGADPRLFPTMVEVTVVVAAAAKDPPRSRLSPLPASAACNWKNAEIYPRRTFHGPLFQGVRGIDRRSEEGLDGTLEVLPGSGLMRSRPAPELELDPVLIDMLGQAVWLWGSPELFLGRAYLPFEARAVRCYGPRLPPGSQLDLKLRVNRRDKLTVTTDLEVVDSRGDVRLALEQLGDREFSITPALHRLMLEPLAQHFAEVRPLELSLPGQGTTRLFFSTVAAFPYRLLEESFGVWRKALAFLVLDREEREEWRRLEVPLRREIDWLLGRTAAKDALRALLEERTGQRRGCADIALSSEQGGRPVVARGWPTEAGVPQVSISHTEGMVAAIAATPGDGVGLGVDTEKVRTPSQDLLDGAFSRDELALLPADGPESVRSEWVFRFWCAKEALGKARGIGVGLEPHKLSVTRFDPKTGEVTLRWGTGEAPVATQRIQEHVVAVAVVGGPRPQ